MFNPCKSQFAEVLDQFSDPSKAKKLHKKAENLYLMRSFKVTNVCSEQAIQSYNRLEAKYESGELKTDANDWHKNERKLFIWFLICYCEDRKTTIQDLATKDWQLMGSIFFDKNALFLKFQGLSILKNTKRHNWTDQDDDQLKKFVAEINSNQWNSISKLIFFGSDKGKFISAKQCRERWFNHICKEINKDQWAHEEDVRILKLTLEIGKKWSQIARLLGTHRTEHMVKNRFNSIINKIRRKKMENEQILTKKALSMLQKQKQDQSQSQDSIEQKQREISVQRPTQKQKMVIEIVPKAEEKDEGVKTSFLTRISVKDSEAELYNLSNFPEGELNSKELKNFIGKKDKGCFAFNADESVQVQNPEQFFLSMTPNSMKAISPGIPNFFSLSFDNFLGRKQDGGQLCSPAPQSSYSPAPGFFTGLSPGIDMFTQMQRDRNGLNSSRQYFTSSSIFTPVPNDCVNESKNSTASRKQRRQMQE